MNKKEFIKFIYKNYFWLLSAGVITISLTIFIVNNLSPVPSSHVYDEAINHAAMISEILTNTQDNFDVYEKLIEELNEDVTDEFNLLKNITVVFKRFGEEHEIVEGYFFNLLSASGEFNHEVYQSKENQYHISMLMEPFLIEEIDEKLGYGENAFWTTCYNPITGKVNMVYVIPVYKSRQYNGFAGFTINPEYLNEHFFSKLSTEYTHAGLFTKNFETLIFMNDPPGSMLYQVRGGIYKDFYNKIKEENSGHMLVRENGQAWTYAFMPLKSGQYFLYAQKRLSQLWETNVLIILCALFAVSCLMLVQGVGKDNLSVFDRLSQMVMTKLKNREGSLYYIGNKAAFAVHVALICQLFSYLIFSLIMQYTIRTVVISACLLIVVLLFLRLYIRSGAIKKNFNLYALVMLTVPLMLHWWLGGFSGGRTGETIIWMIGGILLCIFLSDTRLLFGIFVMLLFTDVLFEIYILANDDYTKIFHFVTNLFFLGFAVFTSVDIYVSHSIKSYSELETLHNQLKGAQSSLVQKEKMVTLGRLIAGVAHEINTPLGAVKASTQTMETALIKILDALIHTGRNLSEEDYSVFIRLVNLLVHSAKQMYSTIYIRRSKPVITEYLNSLEIKDSERVLRQLLQLEICDIEIIRENEDIFVRDNISDILDLTCSVAPFVNSIYTILFATGKVSKIVFALRSYSHTNISGEFSRADVVKSIDNVLVLYHNQVKAGVEVIKDYGTLPEILGNWDELGQLWTNLIHNALQAMDNQGTLTITILDTKDGFFEVRFKDTGVGIEEENLKVVFEPFYTTKPLGEGTGLGLDICRRIVEKHDGSIRIESRVGVGTDVVVRLPVKV